VGHTHGGQIGLFGRSAFEALAPELHLWGTYARGESRLYTTSGFGHWFPFRLGCPTEAPILELVREPDAALDPSSGVRTEALLQPWR
jgi:uncharacterized protein